MNKRIPIFAGNWKMNKFLSDLPDYAETLQKELKKSPLKAGEKFEVIVAPTALHLLALKPLLRGGAIALAAQNCGPATNGAFTGEVSPSMLKEVGCDWVILGHSERRHVFGETNECISRRLEAASQEELKVIFCVGERIEERRAGQTFDILETQLKVVKECSPRGAISLDSLVVAYEPVWAIGTGENATPSQAQEAHHFIRSWLGSSFSAEMASKIRVLYGGSVKPENAASIMEQSDVDGLLVGGASLDASSFAGVIRNGLKSRV